MMKLVDVPDSKSGVLRDVWVRAPLSALNNYEKNTYIYNYDFYIPRCACPLEND